MIIGIPLIITKVGCLSEHDQNLRLQHITMYILVEDISNQGVIIHDCMMELDDAWADELVTNLPIIINYASSISY